MSKLLTLGAGLSWDVSHTSPALPLRTGQQLPARPVWCHSGEQAQGQSGATSQGQSHRALGHTAGAEGRPSQPCQPHTAHPQSRAGQHILTLGQQFIGINQSHSLSIPRCCCSAALWGWGRDSTAPGLGQQCLGWARCSALSCPPQAPRFSGISMETRCAKRYKARISFPSIFHSSRTFVHLIVTYFTGTRQQGESLTHRCAA